MFYFRKSDAISNESDLKTTNDLSDEQFSEDSLQDDDVDFTGDVEMEENDEGKYCRIVMKDCLPFFQTSLEKEKAQADSSWFLYPVLAFPTF